jgi:hypothetical protein
MTKTRSSRWTEEDEDEEDLLDRGFIVVSEGIAWGPFEEPNAALAFALKNAPDMLFKLHVLMNPDLLE